MLGTVWRLSKGYRLRPWHSPYLRWRMETFAGGHAESFTATDFFRFIFQNRQTLTRFLAWSDEMNEKYRLR